MNYEHFNHGEKSIFLVDMKREDNKVFSEIVLKGLKKYINLGKKIAIIVNKKGFSSGVLCQDCGFIPKCDQCDIPIAYHLDNAGKFFGICHICKKQYSSFDSCGNCGGFEIKPYGIGTQKISGLIKEQFGKDSMIIESETVNSPNKIKSIQSEIKNHQIVIGTSLLTGKIKSVDFDLMVFLNADIGLNIPDYLSNYNNFTFLYETFTKQSCNNFIVQTFNPENYTITHACNLDFKGFKETELSYRKDFNYPPYTDICVLLYKNEIEEKLFNGVNKLYQELLFLKEKYNLEDLEIYSTPPLIYKIYGKYRYNIILKGPNLKQFVDIAFSKLKILNRSFKVDWNPQNLI